jgi:hypothetical protein
LIPLSMEFPLMQTAKCYSRKDAGKGESYT